MHINFNTTLISKVHVGMLYPLNINYIVVFFFFKIGCNSTCKIERHIFYDVFKQAYFYLKVNKNRQWSQNTSTLQLFYV